MMVVTLSVQKFEMSNSSDCFFLKNKTKQNKTKQNKTKQNKNKNNKQKNSSKYEVSQETTNSKLDYTHLNSFNMLNR